MRIIDIIKQQVRRGVFILISLLVSSSWSGLKADHIAGNDLYWTCTSTPGIYKITFVFFRTCTGIALCPTQCNAACSFGPLNITGADPTCYGSSFGSVSLSLVSVADVSANPLCPSAKSICNNMGCVTAGTYMPGLERYTFEGLVNLGTGSGIPANCCNVNISWYSCCRSAEINTGSTWQGYYTYCTINRCANANAPCNNAPTFTNDPIAIMCGGQPFVFNNGAVDPDGDSLSFGFVPSLQGLGSSVTYLSPYSPQTPMPFYPPANGAFPLGISCDSITGDIAFTPAYGGTGMFVGVMAIQVTQWRTINGVPTIVGVTRRDLQMWVINCPPNNPPRIMTNPAAGPNLPKLNWDVCAGDQLCFDVIAKDTDFNPPTLSDTTYLSWNAALAPYGATFLPKYVLANRHKPPPLGGPREDIYQFCWTPTDAMARTLPYYFTLNAKDSRCPNPGTITRAMSIRVLPRANINIVKHYAGCSKWSVSYTKNIPSQVFTLVTWHISKVPNDYSLSNIYQYINVSTTPIMTFTTGGKYLIELLINTPGPGGSSCTAAFYDTLLVDTAVMPFVRDTFVCIGNSVTIPYTARWGHPTYFFRWFIYPDTVFNPINAPNYIITSFTLSPGVTTRYTLQVRDLMGCRGYDSNVMVVVQPLPTFLPMDTARICPGDSFTMDLGNNNGNVKQYRWSTGDTSRTLTRMDSNNYVLKITDNYFCENTDTFHLHVNRKIPADAGADTSICKGDTATLHAAGGMFYQWRNLNTGAVIQAKSYTNGIRVNPTGTTSYEVRVYDSYPDTTLKYLECSNVDTMVVTVNPIPVITRPQPVQICKSTKLQLLSPFSVFPTGGVGVWSYPSAPGALTGTGANTQVKTDSLKNLPYDSVLYSAGNTNYIHFKYTAPPVAPAIAGCVNNDSAAVMIYGVPPITITSDVKWCQNGGPFKLQGDGTRNAPYNLWNYTPYDALGVKSVWTGNGVNKINLSPTTYRYEFNPLKSDVVFSPQLNTLTYAYTKTYAFTNSPSCTNQKTVEFEVVPLPKVDAGQDMAHCSSDPIFNIATESGASTTGGGAFWRYVPVSPLNGIDKATKDSQNFDPMQIIIPITQNPPQLTFKLVYSDISTGCVARDTAQITIVKIPTVSLTFDDPAAQPLNGKGKHLLNVCRNTGNVYLTPTATPAGGTASHVTTPVTSALSDYGVTGKLAFNTLDGSVTSRDYAITYSYGFQIPNTIRMCKSSDTTTIQITEPPTIAITSRDDRGCPKDSAFTMTLNPPQTPYTFKWTIVDGGGYWQGGTDNNPSVIYVRDSVKDIAKGGVWIKATTVKINNCPPATDSVMITLYPSPYADFYCNNCEGCEPLTPVLAAKYAGMPVNYTWNVDGADKSVTDSAPYFDPMYYNVAHGATYKVKLTLNSTTNPSCVSTSPVREINVHAKPIAMIGADPEETTIARPNFNFNNKSNYPDNAGGRTFMWNFGPESGGGVDRTSTDENPRSVNFAAEVGNKLIRFKTTTQYGCSDDTIMVVRILPDITVFIPNAFYPNSQIPCTESKDIPCDKEFKPAASGYQTIEIFIFNRWGQQVFHTNNSEEGWNGYMNNDKNGTPCPQDVYIYQINASSWSGKSYKYSGSVTLLR